MQLNKLLLMAALGLTMSALSSQAAQVTVLDVLNLTGVGPVLNTNAGGGNQHGGSTNPLFSFNGDLPRITVQRSSFGTAESYLVIYQGTITKNQAPPVGSPVLAGSDVTLANPADFYIDFSSASPVAQQIQALLLTALTSTWTIAVVEVTGGNKTKTDASFQFNFPGLKSINGALSPTLNVTTQSGKNE
jgi:hypothetical protein